jgi:CheY-like chemotaxis protein
MRVKVLVAETDERASKALVRHLKARGHEVVTAHEAMSTLKAARESQPDIVLMNASIGGGGGLVALRRIRSNLYTANIPVLAVTGRSGPRAKELMAAGAQECLANPVDPGELDAAIERHRMQELDFTEPPAATLGDKARLADLKASGLLNTPPEASFDRLTRLATRLLRTPSAVMNLVDKDQQFYKSQVGMAEPWASQRRMQLSHSFCKWVVAGNEALVVPDATQHPVLKSSLVVKEMGVVAYAGVPLSGRSGEAIGSFCAVDSQARQWSDDDLATLRDLAMVTEAYATLVRAKKSRSAARAQVSMHVAGNAIAGAARILKRHGEGMAYEERVPLLEIIEEQARHLVESSPDRPH